MDTPMPDDRQSSSAGCIVPRQDDPAIRSRDFTATSTLTASSARLLKESELMFNSIVLTAPPSANAGSCSQGPHDGKRETDYFPTVTSSSTTGLDLSAHAPPSARSVGTSIVALVSRNYGVGHFAAVYAASILATAPWLRRSA